MTEESITNLKNQLQEVMDIIDDAQYQVEKIMRKAEISSSHFDSYGKYGFSQLLGNGNPYDSSLHTIMNELEELIYLKEEEKVEKPSINQKN